MVGGFKYWKFTDYVDTSKNCFAFITIYKFKYNPFFCKIKLIYSSKD